MPLIITLAITAILAITSVEVEDITVSEIKPLRGADMGLEQPLNNKQQIYATVYAYSSEINQTDSDPFTTADGSRVKKGIVANNCLEFGTRVIIRGEIYEVHDRMHSRYDCSVFDIWFENTEDAKRFGRQTLKIKIKKQPSI